MKIRTVRTLRIQAIGRPVTTSITGSALFRKESRWPADYKIILSLIDKEQRRYSDVGRSEDIVYSFSKRDTYESMGKDVWSWRGADQSVTSTRDEIAMLSNEPSEPTISFCTLTRADGRKLAFTQHAEAEQRHGHCLYVFVVGAQCVHSVGGPTGSGLKGISGGN